MKRFVSVMIAIMMVFSVMLFVVSAAGETVTLYVGSEESEAEVTGSSVDLEQTEDGVAATTTGGDPWISIALPDVDTSVYKFFTVTYRCNKEVGGNNTYMKTTNYIGAGDGGDWAKGVVRRFTITIPIEELTGSNVVCAVAQLEDGQIIKLNDATAGNNRDTTVTIRSADPEPENNTQTGDMTVAMFAVIAVLAMGAAVVFMKKKAF